MPNFRNLKEIQINENVSIVEALEKINETAIHTGSKGFIVLIDSNEKCSGVLTDGDFRRMILEKIDLQQPVKFHANKDFKSVGPNYSSHEILRFFDSGLRSVPVIDKEGKLVDLLVYDKFLASARGKENIFRAKSPVRVSFAGGGTDMSFFFQQNKGYVLSTTINKYCYASLKMRSDDKIFINNGDLGINLEFQKDSNNDLIKSCVKIMEPDYGFELFTHSEIEPGTGLGGSSAMSSAVIGAFNKADSNRYLDKYHIADLAYQAERIDLGIEGGWQDQYATVFGGFNLIEFRNNEIIVVPLRINPDVLHELQYNLLLFRVGATRNSGDIITDQKYNFEKSSDQKEYYMSLATLALKMKDELLRGELTKFGRSLHEGWLLKKKLSNNISGNHIDEIYSESLRLGALGGKVLGAGGGGHMLLYCRPKYQSEVINHLISQGGKRVDFDFIDHGLENWETFVESDE